MRRLALLLFILTLYNSAAKAQIESLKLHIEGNYFWLSNKNFDENNFLNAFTTIQNGDYGFEIGYSAKIKLKGSFTIDTDLDYSKNTVNVRDPNGVKQSFGYIGLSEKIAYSINPKLSIYTGPHFNYLVALTGGNFINPDTSTQNLKRYNFGIISGIAIRFGKVELFGDIDIGLISLFIQDDNGSERFRLPNSKSRSISIGLGYIFD